MKYLNKILLAFTIVGMVAVSCNKEDVNKGKPNNEKTIIKLPQAAEEVWNIALDAVPGELTLDVLEVRRDASSESDLNKTLVVKIVPDLQAITDWNNANPNADPLSLFTTYTNDASNPFDGTAWTLTFNPGEFVKYIKIKFDPTAMDFSKRNVIPFKVTDASGAQISNGASAALVEVAVKNKYDGVYMLTGSLVDYASASLGPVDQEVALITTGANTVKMIPLDLGIEGHLINSAGALSYYGSYGPVFTFDLATDKVTAVTNIYGQPAGNTRSAEIDPSGANIYDPVTKTITVKYWMKQPASIPAPPHIRVVFDEVLTYLRSR